MAKPSVNQLLKDGTMKRADAYKIRLSEIHVRDNFNPKDRFDFPNNEQDVALYEHVCQGGALPDIWVAHRPGGDGVDIIDGHRRHAAISLAKENGKLNDALTEDGDLLVPVKFFEGNDADQLAFICTSNDSKELTSLQRGEVYARMKKLGMSLQEIALKVKKSLAHVEQALILQNDAPYHVQQLVKDGKISATLAIRTVREHGAEKAAEVLDSAIEKLEENADADTSANAQATTAKKPRITEKAINKVIKKIPDKRLLDHLEASDLSLIDENGQVVATGTEIRAKLTDMLLKLEAADATNKTPDMFAESNGGEA